MNLLGSEFTSWDEVPIGGEIVWAVTVDNEPLVVKRVEGALISSSLRYVSGSSVYKTLYSGWSDFIHRGDKNGYGIGWRLWNIEQPYDPTQAGDTDEDI